MGGRLFFVLMILAVSLSAYALTGSGNSVTGALETVSPTLQSVSAVTERSLSATFSEPMLPPSCTTPENYAVSGLGAGTLASTPDGVTGSGPYTLTWTAGEMRNGASITVTATGLQDAVGNPIHPAHTAASASGLGVAPLFTGLSVTPAQAAAGTTVTITFTASETLDGDPVVTVNGHEATWISGAKAVDYAYEYVVQPTDALGAAALSVNGSDLAGNAGGLNDNALLEILEAGPMLPVYAWPVGIALLVAAVFVVRGGRTRGQSRLARVARSLGTVPIFLCLFASASAFAQAPTVSNVTFTQSPTATGTQVDIYYDLLAPNGPCAITVSLSKDGGTDGYSHPVTSATGDIANVTTGPGKHIVWDIRADYAEEDIPNAQLRVMADDGLVQHTLTYTAGPDGSITGDSPQTVNHGGNGSQVTAVPNTGYHFVQWSDGILTAARTDTNVVADITVTAEFAANANLVFCWANPSEAGSVTGPATILTGGTAALTVSTNPGYTYQSISAIIGDVTGSYPNFTLSNVTADVTVTADFTLNQYMLMYTAGANGSITGTSPQMVSHGGSGTQVTAVPNGGYAFSQWSDGVLTASRTDANVTADINVTANFVPAAPLVTLFALAGGAASTANTDVTLDNTTINSPTEYMASEASDFLGASWQAYGTAPSFTLSSGEGGTKTVHFKVRNAGGESAPVSDTINLTERTIQLPGSVPLVLVWVPSGSYQMGRYAGEVDSQPSEDPQHAVTLAYGFWMGKYEVTQQQWIAVRSTWPSTAPDSTFGLGDTHPAYYISWNDTKDFITSLNAHIVSSGQGPLTVRLPSEAEWEYACRAGTTTRFYWGDDSGYTQIGTYAWYTGNNSPNGSKPVAGKTANASGLYDMSGNVWEWCEDDYHGSYTGAPADGSAWIDSPRASYRIFRGAGWNYVAWGCRSAYRIYSLPTTRTSSIGFRLAAVVPPPPVVTSFAINSGAATTTDPAVTLNNTATNSPTEYMASEASDFAGASWQAYGTAPTFTLSAGTGGTKTVYFKVRSADGESAPVSDTTDLVERTILLPGSVPLVLRWVPSGSFQMGRYAGEVDSIASEDPQHPVTLAYGFWMGKYEVTQQQWIAVRSTWPSTAPSVAYGLGNTYPAYSISWDHTKDFITTLNAHIVSSGQGPLTVRLPSEAEWEYACRGGTQTRFYWGDDSGYTQIGAYAWYTGNNSPNGSKAVSGKMGNVFGLYDMTGNIWEWCEDDYHESYSGAPNDGSPWIDSPRASYRSIRGGYWGHLAMHCRSAFRGYSGPSHPDSTIGFRLAAVQ